MQTNYAAQNLKDILDLPQDQIDSAAQWAGILPRVSLSELVHLSIRVNKAQGEAMRARIGLRGQPSPMLENTERKLRVMWAGLEGEIARRDLRAEIPAQGE